MSAAFQSTGAVLRPYGQSTNYQRWDGTKKTGERQAVVGLYLTFEQVEALGLDPEQPVEVALRNVTPADEAPTPVAAVPTVTPRKRWVPAPWHAAALADYREARLVWERTRDEFSNGYDTERAEFAELYPAPRLADFIRDHAARLRAERGDDTEQAA